MAQVFKDALPITCVSTEGSKASDPIQ